MKIAVNLVSLNSPFHRFWILTVQVRHSSEWLLHVRAVARASALVDLQLSHLEVFLSLESSKTRRARDIITREQQHRQLSPSTWRSCRCLFRILRDYRLKTLRQILQDLQSTTNAPLAARSIERGSSQCLSFASRFQAHIRVSTLLSQPINQASVSRASSLNCRSWIQVSKDASSNASLCSRSCQWSYA